MQDLNGFGNDSHCTLLITGNETVEYATTPDEIYVQKSKGGYAHTFLSPAANVVTGQFGNAFASTTGGEYIYISDLTNSSDWMGIRNIDFTIDFWVYVKVYPTTSSNVIIECIDGSVYGFRFYVDETSKKLIFTVEDGVAATLTLETLAAIPEDSTFRHVAITRSGTTFNLYLNGVFQQTRTSSINVTPASNKSLSLFYNLSGSSTTYGAICEFRISQNIVRWNSNFTVPNRAY